MEKVALRWFFGFAAVTLIFGVVRFAARAQEAPATLTAAVRSACAVDLSWSAVSGTGNSYELQYTTEPSFFGGGTLLTTTAATSYAHKPLRPETEHRYRARTINGESVSAWTYPTPPFVTTPALPAAPGTPGGFSGSGVNDADLSAGTDDGKQIDISWTSATLSQYGGFVVERAASDRPNVWISLGAFPPTLRSFRDGVPPSFLDNTRAYRYRIAAFENAAECLASDRQFSASSTVLTVPSVPKNLTAVYQYNPNASVNKIELSWTAGTGQAGVEIYRKLSTETSFSPTPLAALPQANADKYNDNTVAPNQSYTYRVRGVAEASGVKGYSAYSNEARAAAANAPQNFMVKLKSVGATTAEVNLTWDNVFPEQNYKVERAEVGGGGSFAVVKTVAGPAASVTAVSAADTPSLGKRYRYRVYADFGGRRSENSEVREIDLNLTAVKGWAWSGNGFGWIRLSHDSPNSSWGPAVAPNETIPYGVYMDSDGLLSGYAWNPYAGWLSFNKGDLKGCLGSTPVNEDQVCVASVGAIDPNQRFRNVMGWAKFVGDGKGNGLGQFVSLSQKSGEPFYKLVHATTTDGAGELRGFAWGGDVTGWLSFGGPILRSVTPIPGTGITSSVTVEWENPISYSKIQIYALEKIAGSDFEDKSAYVPRTKIEQENLLVQGAGKTAIITDLKPNTEYGFYVKGFPR